VSPSGRPSSLAFKSLLIILPDLVLGNLSTNSISRGYSLPAKCSFTKFVILSFNLSLALTPSFNTTKALIISPLTSSGFPITPASIISGCSTKALSTSNGPTRSPEVLMTSSARPTNQKYPSPSLIALSPEIYQPFLK